MYKRKLTEFKQVKKLSKTSRKLPYIVYVSHCITGLLVPRFLISFVRMI